MFLAGSKMLYISLHKHGSLLQTIEGQLNKLTRPSFELQAVAYSINWFLVCRMSRCIFALLFLKEFGNCLVNVCSYSMVLAKHQHECLQLRYGFSKALACGGQWQALPSHQSEHSSVGSLCWSGLMPYSLYHLVLARSINFPWVFTLLQDVIKVNCTCNFSLGSTLNFRARTLIFAKGTAF